MIGLSPPNFNLPDQDGRAFQLSDHLGNHPVLLVFIRGHWCPYCRRYLEKLRANFAKFQSLGVQVVAISPEPPATSRRLADQLSLPFPILSDSDGRVIDLYGARNGFRGGSVVLPHAAVFVISDEGLLAFRSIDRNYKRRTTMHALFSVLRNNLTIDEKISA